ncbi:hypothetical protein [Methanoregula sp.]|uniref:hypothetical protein n=1 Tax=Methanoregula sp. TaxID=2052170 RepID=UPI003C793D2A
MVKIPRPLFAAEKMSDSPQTKWKNPGTTAHKKNPGKIFPALKISLLKNFSRHAPKKIAKSFLKIFHNANNFLEAISCFLSLMPFAHHHRPWPRNNLEHPGYPLRKTTGFSMAIPKLGRAPVSLSRCC